MAYILGVSSGIFGAVRGAEPRERMEYAGISRKVHYAIYKGVKFNQIDIESVTEFKEPALKKHLHAMRNLGIDYAFHGETRAFGAEVPVKLDSAIDDEYSRSHLRLLTSLRKSGELKAKYYLLHSSESEPFLRLRFALQPLMLVDIWGRPLSVFLEDKENEELLDWAIRQEFITRLLRGSLEEFIKSRTETLKFTERREATEEDIERFTNEFKERFKRDLNSSEPLYGAERIAYYIIAKWMEMNKDFLWETIVKQNVEEYEERNGEKLEVTMDNPKFREADNYQLWVPAVAAKYIWGHFNQEKCPTGAVFEDPKKILEENKLYFVIESPMGPPGHEKLNRLARPLHIHHLVKAIGSEWIRVAWDFEHILSCDIDVDEEIKRLPDDAGSLIKVIHLGWPTPIGPAHIPIPVGSEQQLILYTWLYELRKRGFKDGYLIFERGAGKDPIGKSVQVMRWIKHELENDTPPEKLPDEFFGLPRSPLVARQRLIILEHAFDPLKGVLKVPEEEHTLLSTAAIRAGKRPEEWKKEELR